LRILGVSGSLQSRSSNLELLHVAARTAPAGVEIAVFEGLRALPHFDPDLEAAGVPDAVRVWRRAIADSDALLIASPEYGHSLPGALKNGIDWVIGSGELERKVVAITAAVPARERGRRGILALGRTLRAVSADLVCCEPIVRGPAFEAGVRDLVRRLVARAATRIGG
jgi:chromate reductase